MFGKGLSDEFKELRAENELLRNQVAVMYGAQKGGDLHPPAKARERETLERQIMDSCIAKNDAEWWAMREIERLRAALDSIAKNTCCDRCQEAAVVAREALTGGCNNS